MSWHRAWRLAVVGSAGLVIGTAMVATAYGEPLSEGGLFCLSVWSILGVLLVVDPDR